MNNPYALPASRPSPTTPSHKPIIDLSNIPPLTSNLQARRSSFSLQPIFIPASPSLRVAQSEPRVYLVLFCTCFSYISPVARPEPWFSWFSSCTQQWQSAWRKGSSMREVDLTPHNNLNHMWYWNRALPHNCTLRHWGKPMLCISNSWSAKPCSAQAQEAIH